MRVLVVRGLGKSERMSIMWKSWLRNRGSHLSFFCFFFSWEEVPGFVQCAMAGIVVVCAFELS